MHCDTLIGVQEGVVTVFHSEAAMAESSTSKTDPGKRTGAKRGTGKREQISPKGDARYVRRDAKGRITESDDVRRSLKQDRARKAKTKVKSGQSDRGDR
jgi:hypothetical protein